MGENFIREFHSNGLGGHVGVNKTRDLEEDIYYLYGVSNNMRKWVEGC